MIRKSISTKRRVVLGVLAFVVFSGLYFSLSAWTHHQNPTDATVPSLSQLIHGVIQIVQYNENDRGRWIVMDSEATLSRLFLGLLTGISGAFVLGILMGCFVSWEAFWYLPISILAKIPPTAALAVFFVMLGTDTQMYIAMIAFGILPSLTMSVHLNVREVSDQIIEKTYTLGATSAEVVWNVIVRQILPKFIDNIRLQIGPAIVYLVAAEMVCASEGFGYRIRLMFKKLDMEVVFPYLLILAFVGFALAYLLQVAQRKLCPWYVKQERGKLINLLKRGILSVKSRIPLFRGA